MQKRHEELLSMLCLRHAEISSFQLCYVEGDTAYFTNHFDDQWGDDWGDAPYEHNAGHPYSHKGSEIYRVKFEGVFDTPCDQHYNSPYSVAGINERNAPWLTTTKCVGDIPAGSPMWAGSTTKEFITYVLKHNGDVFIKLD